MKSIIEKSLSHLGSGEGASAEVVSIIASQGSAPRKKGAVMVVCNTGDVVGTIGGGALERYCVEFARGLIAEKRSMVKDFDLAGREETTPFAMACGGKVSVSFKYYNHATADEFSKDYAAYLQNPKCYIFGAGHVARCLSKVLDFVGFDVYVYDPRPEFANKEHHPKAKGIFTQDYSKIPEHITIGESDCAVVMTHGHLNDIEVVSHLLKTNAKYIGCIGSLSKKATMFSALKQKGFKDAELKRIHCPVGVEIGAETPEEIAISIASEIIAYRYKVSVN